MSQGRNSKNPHRIQSGAILMIRMRKEFDRFDIGHCINDLPSDHRAATCALGRPLTNDWDKHAQNNDIERDPNQQGDIHQSINLGNDDERSDNGCKGKHHCVQYFHNNIRHRTRRLKFLLRDPACKIIVKIINRLPKGKTVQPRHDQIRYIRLNDIALKDRAKPKGNGP